MLSPRSCQLCPQAGIMIPTGAGQAVPPSRDTSGPWGQAGDSRRWLRLPPVTPRAFRAVLQSSEGLCPVCSGCCSSRGLCCRVPRLDSPEKLPGARALLSGHDLPVPHGRRAATNNCAPREPGAAGKHQGELRANGSAQGCNNSSC